MCHITWRIDFSVFVGLEVNNPVEGVLLRGSNLSTFLRIITPFDTIIKGSIISVHGSGFRATTGLMWAGDTGITLNLISIAIIMVAGEDVSHVGFLGPFVLV